MHPILRFVQINDLHVQAENPAPPTRLKTYVAANTKAQWLVTALGNGTFGPPPDFVLGVGDLAHGETLERLGPDLNCWRALERQLPCPYYPAIGNHEVIQQERSAKHLGAYTGRYGAERVDYCFKRSGILFIVLNNAGAPNADCARQRNAWLAATLAAHPTAPKIVACHIPLVSIREEAVLAKSFGFSSYLDHDGGTLALLEAHAETVIAVLSGHLHITGMLRQKGIAHLVVSGPASYPADGGALFELYPAHLAVRILPLPDELARLAPSIHDRVRHGVDFTDRTHPTVASYHFGNPDERQFCLPLTAAKCPKVTG